MNCSIQAKRKRKRFVLVLFALPLIALLLLLVLNLYMTQSMVKRTLSAEDCAALGKVDCILVLGCGVHDGVPSRMLRDRLEGALQLYHLGASEKLLMSGDHGQANYDEVNVMKRYAMEHGVPSEAVFMDHAGFSTYESMVRAQQIFSAKRILIVTQDYHLPRALYIANALGLDAYGFAVPAPKDTVQHYRNAREYLARAKDFFCASVLPTPTYEGEVIPVSGNGDLTNG